MRIVHLVIGGEVAGGQLVALQLARAARARGDEVSFVAPERGPFTELAGNEGFAVHVVPLRRSFQLASAWRLARLLRRGRADVLHTHTLAAANALARLAGAAARVPVVSHLHIENHFRPPTRLLLAGFDNATARLSARLVAVSEDTRRAYERQGYPRGRIEVVYNGVDLPANGAFRRNEPARIGEIARLCDVKGQRELLHAVARLPEAQLVLAGRDLEQGGAFQDALERESERLGIRERVEFGFHDDVPALLDTLDVVALPSWTEGLPMVLLEAMARARPVVATPVGGTPELVTDGETGLLVPPRDPEALADALRRVLDDPELARRLAEAGRERVAERFNAAEQARRMLEIYDEAVAER
jgi:glycosyltransferase involved in cell wall biosynthesis